MSERSSLLDRKDDLYAALRTLQRDYEDGAIDPDAYLLTRNRYEQEAAAVLEELDSTDEPAADTPRPAGRRTPVLALLVSCVVAIAAVAIFLIAGLRDRAPAAAAVATIPPPPPAVQRAEHVYAQHPHRLTAVMGLGTAYLNNGDAVDAAVVFHQAMTMAPSDPAPATMDALALSTSGKNLQARARLRGVERAHPNYARAWLVDGLMPISSAQARAHTIVALRHFLRLQPHNRVAPAVRTVLKRLENTK